jgi:hypothetical protein
MIDRIDSPMNGNITKLEEDHIELKAREAMLGKAKPPGSLGLLETWGIRYVMFAILDV